jgi:two-component system C4-dicarboxylate transport response regulator DctD
MNLAVLIVDDELSIAEETSIGLELEGYVTLIADSANKALAIVASRPDIGVLISDVRMPVVDGVSLAKQVLDGRRSEDALSVILMTGHAENTPPKGVTACIAKPFSMSSMATLVARAMTDAAARRNGAMDQSQAPLLL